MADSHTRQAKRSPVTLKIKFKSATVDQFIERYSVDVSHGGIFIRTKDPLPVGTAMRFEFQLKDATPLIQGEGTVVWTREQDPKRAGVAPGMGVRFDRLTEGSQEILARILRGKTSKGTSAKAFSDVPTRVAPSPLVQDLARESMMRRASEAGGMFAEERTDSTPLPTPVPFHSDVDEFPDEAFEEATKVRSVDDLIAMSANAYPDDRTLRKEGTPERPDDDMRPTRRNDVASPSELAAMSSGPAEALPDTLAIRPGEFGYPDSEGLRMPTEPTVPATPRLLDQRSPSGSMRIPDLAPPEEEEPTMAVGQFTASAASQRPSRRFAAIQPLPTLPQIRPPGPDQPEALPPVEAVVASRMADSGPAMRPPMVAAAGAASATPPRTEAAFSAGANLAAARSDATPGPGQPARPNEDRVAIAHVSRVQPDSKPGGGRGAVFAVLAILVLGFAAAGYFLFLRDEGLTGTTGDPVTTNPIGTREPDAAVAVAVPDGSAAAPDTTLDAAPEIEPEIEIEPDDTSDAGTAVAPPDVKRVPVELRASPHGAIAELVGTDQQGPMPITFQVPEGQPYRVRVSSPGYTSQELTLDPKNRKPSRIKLEIEPWILRLRSEPAAARVYVEGRKAGDTPLDFIIPAGMRSKPRFKVSFRLDKYQKLDLEVLATELARDGESMVATVNGTLVARPVVVRTSRPKPDTEPDEPTVVDAGTGTTLPPDETTNNPGGARKPDPAPAPGGGSATPSSDKKTLTPDKPKEDKPKEDKPAASPDPAK